jgi:hypothetical protein
MIEVDLVCPECGTRRSFLVDPDDPSGVLGERVSRHNETMHDGAAVAVVAEEHIDRMGVAL